jgi:myo-inositol-1(or 4)-monophosphatase
MEDDVVKKIEKLLYKCGDILINADYDNLNISKKPGINNYVTKYDKNIQEYLRNNLLKIIPNSSFIGEENGDYNKGLNGYKFIVDPIDGTTNFVQRFNISAISVALLHGEEVIIGVCYNPYSKEIYKAIKGKGAYLNNQRIHVSNKNLNAGIVICGLAPYYDNLREQALIIQNKFVRYASDYRRFGSAVIEICSIASGKAEVYFELKLMTWDYAAASLILEEAGGKITTLDNKPIQYQEPSSILASNGIEDYFKYIR